MAYKNSGAMKFNDATDLVIRADPDGTVESCYNKSDHVEYVSEWSPLQTATVTVNNIDTSSRSVIIVRLRNDGTIDGNTPSIPASGTSQLTVVKNTDVRVSSTAQQLSIVSGSAEVITEYVVKVTGDCELNIFTP